MNNIKRQSGLGLLELLLVLVIAALLFIMGLRLYEKQQMQQDIDQAKQNARLLLNTTGNYYYAYCLQDINSASPNHYTIATQMLGDPLPTTQNPKTIKLTDLQSKDAYGNQFIENSFNFFFAFGSFTDGSFYRIQLAHLPYQSNQCISASSTQTHTPQNCFAQTGLWQMRISACVSAFTSVTTDPKDPKKKPIYAPPSKAMLKGMFQADEISDFNSDASCINGDTITWESIPSIRQSNFNDQGDALLAADQREFNQMYRYGPWMQQGVLSTHLKQKLEYLCQ
jgi:type II secretory pathway pseudopilin PulG